MSKETLTTITIEGHSLEMIEGICDAFGKGFDQAERDLLNPYKIKSDLWFAYEYGRAAAHEN